MKPNAARVLLCRLPVRLLSLSTRLPATQFRSCDHSRTDFHRADKGALAERTHVYWCRPPVEEMNCFAQNAPAEDDAPPPVLDVEGTPTSPTCHRHLTQDGAIAGMQVMLQEMERHYRKRPILYTTPVFTA